MASRKPRKAARSVSAPKAAKATKPGRRATAPPPAPAPRARRRTTEEREELFLEDGVAWVQAMARLRAARPEAGSADTASLRRAREEALTTILEIQRRNTFQPVGFRRLTRADAE